MEKTCESAKRFGKEGEAEASRNERLESFIRDSGERALMIARGLTQNDDEARELVQEALYRVTVAWNRFDESKTLDAWFITVMRNAYVDRCKRYERRQLVSLDCPADEENGCFYADVLADKADDVPAALERREAVKLAWRALGRMNKSHREVLTLCDVMGHDYDKIAARLKIPGGTVRSRIHKARAAFRGHWSAMETSA